MLTRVCTRFARAIFSAGTVACHRTGYETGRTGADESCRCGAIAGYECSARATCGTGRKRSGNAEPCTGWRDESRSRWGNKSRCSRRHKSGRRRRDKSFAGGIADSRNRLFRGQLAN